MMQIQTKSCTSPRLSCVGYAPMSPSSCRSPQGFGKTSMPNAIRTPHSIALAARKRCSGEQGSSRRSLSLPEPGLLLNREPETNAINAGRESDSITAATEPATAVDVWTQGQYCEPGFASINISYDDSDVLTNHQLESWASTDQPGIDLLRIDRSALVDIQQVFVILFGVGECETEGIYSMRAVVEDGVPQETIILFETEDDAVRYAGLLEATMELAPNVYALPPTALLDFCVDQGYKCRLEPKGSLLIPPGVNVGLTDWERSRRLRSGMWSVLESEPELGGLSGVTEAQQKTSECEEPPAAAEQPIFATTQAVSLPRYHPATSRSQLERIRERLEELLPESSVDL